MHENKDCVENSSQVSESGQEDSPSVPLHRSKLRNKLEKLAPWRIDPSLIEFPEDAREFCGGFAKVSKGLLTSPSRAEGGVNEPEEITDELPNSKAGGPQSDNDPQEPGESYRSNDEEVDGQTAGGDNNHTEVEGTQDDNNAQKPDAQTSIIEVVYGSAQSEHVANGDPGPGDRNPLSESDAQRHEGYQQGTDEGTDSRIGGDDADQTKQVLRRNSGNAEKGPHAARQTSKPKVVAVKKFNIEADTNLERVLGFAIKESEFLVELSHPNVVKLEGFVESLSESGVWLIFPWEEHGNLRDFLASGEQEIPERISLIHDVTLGLEYLHSRDPPIYHGDLKSLNILVDSECHALITDFGSARHLGSDDIARQLKENEHKPPPAPQPTTGEEQITLEAFFNATASTLTLTGSSYTLRWAAPELLQDERPRLRSDIWSLGWIAYEVMTNTIPFHDIKQDAIVINRVVQGHLPSVTEHARMSLIRALCSLMVQCWSINPEKRPTAEECRKSISWMPKIAPAPTQTIDKKTAELRHAQLMIQLGIMYKSQAEYPSAISCYTGALDIYTNHNDNMGRAVTLRSLADVHRFWSQYPEALKFYSQALRIHAYLDNELERAATIFGLADTHTFLFEYDEAVKLYSECLQIHTNTGNKRDRALALLGLADVHRHQEEFNEAIKLYSESLQIFTDVGDQREKALTLWSLAEVHRSQEEYSEAIKLHSEALQIYTDLGDREEEASALWGLAEVHTSRREYREATKLYLKALKIYTDIGNHNERARTLWDLAELHRLQEEYTEADKLYSESLQIRTEFGDSGGRGLALWGLGEVRRARHEYKEAITLFSEARQILTEVDDKYWISETLMSLAETNRMRGHYSEAVSLYIEASEVLKEMGDSSGASDALEEAGDIREMLAEATADAPDTVEIGEEPIMNAE